MTTVLSKVQRLKLTLLLMYRSRGKESTLLEGRNEFTDVFASFVFLCKHYGKAITYTVVIHLYLILI
jgi:hypothetical protein